MATITSVVNTPSDQIITVDEMASTSGTAGAELVGIEDAGGLYTGTTVETALQELGKKITVVDATYTVLTTDRTIIGNKATAFTITLPTATVGHIYTIGNIGAGIITLEGDSSDTIDGELNQTINQYDSITVQCYLANTWKII